MSEQRLCGRPRLTDGQPCGQRIGPDRQCLWHGDDVTPEQRSAIARVGALKHIRALAPRSADPVFRSREEIVEWAEEIAGKVLRGELDPRLSAEARGHALLALAAHDLAARDLLEKLTKVVNIKGRRA